MAVVNGGGGVAASVIHGGTAPKGMNVERHSTTVLWRERDRKRGEREEWPDGDKGREGGYRGEGEERGTLSLSRP